MTNAQANTQVDTRQTQSYIVANHRSGTIKVFTQKEYAATSPITLGNEWVAATSVDNATSKEHAAWIASRQWLDEDLGFVAELVERFLDDQNWTVDTDYSEKFDSLHKLLKEVEVKSVLDGMVKLFDEEEDEITYADRSDVERCGVSSYGDNLVLVEDQ